MPKKKSCKIIMFITVLCMSIVSFVNVYAAYNSSEGWTAVVDETSNGVRMIVSPPHWGWASPEATNAQHVNLILQINGADKSNYHIYNKVNSSGKKCIKAYDSVSRQYFNFSKCHDDTNKAMQEILEGKGSYSLVDKIKDAIPLAVVAVVAIWIVKIVLSIILANPAPLLVPV